MMSFMSSRTAMISRRVAMSSLAIGIALNPGILLLDEPTSNLDSLNEAVILRSLKEEGRDKTVVLVSHRASTMRIAGRVYSVEHGRMS